MVGCSGQGVRQVIHTFYQEELAVLQQRSTRNRRPRASIERHDGGLSVMLLFLVARSYFVRGITMGGIK
jgi:hypothetical protein